MAFRNQHELDEAIAATTGHSRPAREQPGRAKGRQHSGDQDRQNKTEAAFDAHLGLLRVAGEIREYCWQPLKLRLAKATFYTPDFLVIRKDGTIEFAEVKGHWEDDARVKIKVAADTHRWATFAAYTRVRGTWHREAWNDD